MSSWCRRVYACLLVYLAFVWLSAGMGQAQNRLAGESSLYLRQHAEQPIDWYPWGGAALERAKAEGKPIFVSVGYAACHWCHVMAQESFEDAEIAALLNADFVSIKIDRERRPDLDTQFGLVSTLLTGRTGWPNSVFLTPDGAPFFAGGYYPRDEFAQVVADVARAWREDRAEVEATANRVAGRLLTYLDQAAVLGDVSSAEITRAARASIADLDTFNGGFGEAPKFPREPYLLFLLDQAARHGDGDLLQAVTVTLDGMLRGGVHDQIGGGFHRYAIDPEWQIPHFEKMSYNQPLMARSLLRTYALTGNQEYRRAAVRTLEFVLRDLRAPDGAFYAALDADTVVSGGARVEGLYYLWTPEEVAQVLGADAVGAALNIEGDGAFDGRSVPSLGASAQETAAFLDLPLATFDGQLELLRQARAGRPAPIRDEKIILSWNAEMIVTLAEAASVLEIPTYLQAAVAAAQALLDALAMGDGLKRIFFDGRADTPAQLIDYAAFGRAMLALYDHGAGKAWLNRAEALAAEMADRFADPGRAMRMTAQAAGLGPMRPIDDTELASGNAMALEFLAGLDRRMARAGSVAPGLAAATALDAIRQPKQRAGLLTAIEQSRFGPSGPMRVSSGGAVHVMARADRAAGQMTFDVRIAEGWHINAHAPLEDYLIGMALNLEGTALPETAFPDPVVLSLGFSDAPLAVYETGFALVAPLRFPQDGPARATLTLQACNDEICLPPDDMEFHVWPTGAENDR